MGFLFPFFLSESCVSPLHVLGDCSQVSLYFGNLTSIMDFFFISFLLYFLSLSLSPQDSRAISRSITLSFLPHSHPLDCTIYLVSLFTHLPHSFPNSISLGISPTLSPSLPIISSLSPYLSLCPSLSYCLSPFSLLS